MEVRSGVDTGHLSGSWRQLGLAWGACRGEQGELWLPRHTGAGAGPGTDRHRASAEGLPGPGPCVRNSVCLISHIFVDLALWSLITYVFLPYHLSTLVVNEFQEPRRLVSLVH